MFLNQRSVHRQLYTNTALRVDPAGKVCTKEKYFHEHADPVHISTAVN